MPRGAPRKHDPTIPEHIDQRKIPVGVYWDRSGNGRWMLRELASDGRRRSKAVAGATAQLSDLHAIVESRKGGPTRGTIAAVIEQFHAHRSFRELAPRTQRDYRAYAAAIEAYPTPRGILGTLVVDKLGTPNVRELIDRIADGRPSRQPGEAAVPPHPTKANHWLRYLRRVFSFGVQYGHCRTNPAKGVQQVKERAHSKMPQSDAFARVVAFSRERGSRKPHTSGSVAPYLWAVMTLAYTCRLRGIEVVTLTDANAQPDGIRSNRRKGSRDNVTRWTPDTRLAWEWLVDLRTAANERHRRPTMMRPDERPIVTSQDGGPLRKSSLDTAWQRLMALAIREGVLSAQQRFTLHGIKHRGITDSVDKSSGGHKSEAMRHRYDHQVPVVDAAGSGGSSVV